jgi:hypothetical protein
MLRDTRSKLINIFFPLGHDYIHILIFVDTFLKRQTNV